MSKAKAETTVKPAPAKRLSGEARAASFLEAAAEIVSDEGVHAVTMEGVAARAGVNKRLPYRYFDNKDELLTALFDRVMKDLRKRAIAEIGKRDGLEARIAGSVRAWLETYDEKGPLIDRLMYGDEAPLQDKANALRQYWADDWAAVTSKSLGLPENAARTVAHIMLSATLGAVAAHRSRLLPLEEIVRIYTMVATEGAATVTKLYPDG